MVKLMLDTKKFENKPTGIETGGVQKRIKQTEILIKDLAIGLCNGMTCKPALLNGSKSADWMEQQVFMLDFDHDTTIEKELQNCNRLGIEPVFTYTSFSHSENEHHFRMVFVTDEIITNVDKRNKLQNTLINTFDKSDRVTFDCTRIFYGGKGKSTCQSNYDARINADDVINRYYKEECEVNKPLNRSVKPITTNSKVLTPSKHADYMANVDAIKELNVDKLRSLMSEGVLSDTNKEDINNLILSVSTKTPLHSEQEVYDYINCIDIHSFLGISNGEFINCILPKHDDSTPSAHIYVTDSGTQIYKCFGCNKSRTIIGLVEELAHCKRHESIKFIKEVYNIELIQSDWALEQKQLMIDSANYLDMEEFRTQFPSIAKLIRTRKLHIQKMLLHYTQHISDNMQFDDKPLFFNSYSTLLDICGIKGNRNTLSQSITLFTLLNMLDKVELTNIPVDELNKAKSISAKYGFKKLTNFYQFEEYGVNSLEQSEEIAKVLIENNISLKGLSREYVLRTFGTELSDKVFPQYRFENARGTSKKSDDATLKLSEKVLSAIELKGYILEKNVRQKGRTEIQWKKSIQEILDTYGLERIRLNKELKKKYGIAGNGYPFLIVKGN